MPYPAGKKILMDVPSIVQKLNDKSSTVVQIALEDLAALANTKNNQNFLRDAGVIPKLVALLKHSDFVRARKIFHLLALLSASNKDNQSAIYYDEKAVLPLILKYLNVNTPKELLHEVKQCYLTSLEHIGVQVAYTHKGAIRTFTSLLEPYKRPDYAVDDLWHFYVDSLQALLTNYPSRRVSSSVYSGYNHTEMVYSGLSLITHNHRKLREMGRYLLNSFSQNEVPELYDFSRVSDYDDWHSGDHVFILKGTNFDNFLFQLLDKVKKASHFLSYLNPRAIKKEGLDVYVSLLLSLMNAKKLFLADGNESSFKESCITALAAAKSNSLHNHNPRFFSMESDPFLAFMNMIESDLSNWKRGQTSLSLATSQE